MKVINLEQGSQEWLSWRNIGITATEIIVILGQSPYMTPFQLWELKTGRREPEDLSKDPNVRRGNEYEPVVRTLVEAQLGEDLAVICGEHSEHSLIRASFDGVDSKNVPHEFKCPSEGVYAEVEMLGDDSQPYKMYSLQVKYQALVSGANFGWLYFYDVVSNEIIKFKVEVNQEDLVLIERALAFFELIKTDTPPEKDTERDMADGDTYMEAIASRLLTRKVQMLSLEKELAEIKEEQVADEDILVEKMGLFDHFESKKFGVKVSLFNKKGSIDYSAFFESKNISPLETEKFRKKSAASRKVTYRK